MIDGGVEKSYSTFEKILYIFIIPIFFSIVLALALFSLFDYDVKDTLLKYGRAIPLVGQYLPEPSAASSDNENAKVDEFGVDYTKEIRGLNDKIALQKNELSKAVTDVQKKDQLIKELERTVKAQAEQLKAKALSDKEYIAKIQELAAVYASMSSSKAAPIIESLATEEAVLVLNQMNTVEKKNILQKMTPERAAEISILAKDVVPVKDQEIAALQARLKIQDPTADVKTKVSKPEMSDTYSNMDPKIAASILTDLIKNNPSRVYSILANMDAAARSGILTEMPVETASSITDRIGE